MPNGAPTELQGSRAETTARRTHGASVPVPLPGGALPGCPLRDRCVRNPEKGRTVKRLEGEELIEAHKAWMSTPEAKGDEPTTRCLDRTLFRGREATSQSPSLAWSRTEEGQGRGRLGDTGPNRPYPGETAIDRRKPPGKRGLKAGRSLRRGGQGGGTGTAGYLACRLRRLSGCGTAAISRGLRPTPPSPPSQGGEKLKRIGR